MPTRRQALGATAGVLAGSTAGCLDAVPFLGDSPLEFEAAAASVPDVALEDTGYEEHRIRDVIIERTFEAGGQSQDVVVTNWQSEYDRAVDLADIGVGTEQRLQAAIFVVLSTPQVDVLGRAFNPVADMDSEELAEMVQERYEGIDELQQVGEDPASVGGESTTASEFETEAELAETGESVDLTLHITEAVESGDDLLVTIGGYPRDIQEQEKEHVFALMDAVEHDG